MLTVINAKENSQKVYDLKLGSNLIGSNVICDIRINNKQIDKVHLIIKLTEEWVVVMDNQSEKGTYLLENNRRQNLTSQTSYEYPAEEKFTLQIGDFKLEYQYQNGPQGIFQEDEEKDDDLQVEDNGHDFMADATQIIPQNRSANNSKKNNQAPVFHNNKNGNGNQFSFGDATQIIGDFKKPDKKPNDGFLAPSALKKNNINNQKKVEFMNDATQLIDHNAFNQKKDQDEHPEIDPFEPTQLLVPGKKTGQNKDKEEQHNDIFMDATQIIPDVRNQPKGRAAPKQNVPVFGDFNDATQVIMQDNFKAPGAQKKPNQQQQNVNLMDATQIIPVNNPKNQNKNQAQKAPFGGDAGGFEPTLLIQDHKKLNQNQPVKNKKSEIDKLIDSSDDESPRFGKKSSQLAAAGKKRPINSSIEDIFDVLDNKEDQSKPKKDALDAIMEEEEENLDKSKAKGKKVNDKFVQNKIAKNDKKELDERDSEMHDSFDGILQEEEKKEPEHEAMISSQRYNKKRKANDVSNSIQDAQSQQQDKNKRLKKNDEPPAKQQKGNQQEEENEQLVVLVSGKAKDKEHTETIKKLGGRVIDDIEGQFDIMVTDGKLIRNCKLLQAISVGAKVVNINWLKDSQKKKEFVEMNPKYYIVDKDFEKQHGCKLLKLYENNNPGSLLKEQKVFVSSNLQGIKKEQMQKLIESNGGQLIQNEKDKMQATVCILDQDKDKKILDALKKAKDGPNACSVHLIFDGILQQKIDMKKYSLI